MLNYESARRKTTSEEVTSFTSAVCSHGRGKICLRPYYRNMVRKRREQNLAPSTLLVSSCTTVCIFLSDTIVNEIKILFVYVIASVDLRTKVNFFLTQSPMAFHLSLTDVKRQSFLER